MNITDDQLKAIEAALTFTGDPLEAHKACKAIRDNIASKVLIRMARAEIKGLDDIDIDTDAGTSPYDEGTWVQAWVHLRKPTEGCDACNGTGLDTRGTETHCTTCGGEGEVYVEFPEDPTP